MQANLKWLLLPPAIGLVLFLGPLQSGNTGTTSGDAPATVPAEPARTNVPSMPSAWQVSSTLVGVLLLGFVGIAALKRFRTQRPMTDGDYVMLRQSLSLSQKQTVHAVEFDGEVLLLGESDGKLSVLHRGAATLDAARDEAEIRSRMLEEDDLDDGAVPRDMVIPRPARPAAPAARRRPDPRVAAKLANFKNLLSRVGAGSAQ
ncbi:MAG: flagellar biosynthetic protein FliO [Planctomycetes bacterium]|nr:flagellar biosynthetic protein FliO [Planctomycetota bacterium]